MKQLTYSAMATARLRANKRQYLSLVLGIFLSVFLVSSLVLGVYGIYLSFLNDRYDKVGFADMVVLDNDTFGYDEITELDMFDQIGNIFISGMLTDGNVYLGYYDETAQSLVNLKAMEGRLPERAGEIALEKTVMDVLDIQWTIGETVELNITPINGMVEKRSFTIVGFLPEQTEHFTVIDHDGINQLPAIVTSSQEPGFTMGRLGKHHLMTLRDTVSISGALREIHSHPGYYTNAVYGLSISGEQVPYFTIGNLMDANEDMFQLILMASVLAGSLILSCAVGIAGAMEGVLSKRREEIGVLRALGATRRQIRKMFGRENLILALVLAPVSIGFSCLAVWVLALFLPESLIFGFRLWLLAPIAGFSVVVILLAGYLPLVRASKLMPMSVIRDTAMLRRSKKVKMKKLFKPTQLIASRQVRFNPTRQIGAVLLIGLMFLCSGLFVGGIANYKNRATAEYVAFYVQSETSGWYDNDGVPVYSAPSLNRQSIAQIRNMEHVKTIDLDRTMNVTALLDMVPRYVFYPRWATDQYGMLSEEQYQEAIAMRTEQYRDLFGDRYKEDRENYLQFKEENNISGEAFHMPLVTMELTTENLNMLNSNIGSGRINADAINAGREVIVVAPQLWIAHDERGGSQMWHSEAEVKADPNGKDAFLAAWNDVFTAGQELPLTHFYRTETEGTTYREDTSVNIGAVIQEFNQHYSSSACIITTEQGLENMGITPEGLSQISIYLDGEQTLEEEETLERQLNAVARRSGNYSVYNRVESAREQARSNRQTLLLCLSVTILFFAVAVSMIVSSVTRQLNSEGKTIGMLRAVGADERAILGCYSGQAAVSIGCGMALAIGLYGFYFLTYLINALQYGYFQISELLLYGTMAVVICAMGTACWFACRFFLRLRIREIVNKSIIDNIREL